MSYKKISDKFPYVRGAFYQELRTGRALSLRALSNILKEAYDLHVPISTIQTYEPRQTNKPSQPPISFEMAIAHYYGFASHGALQDAILEKTKTILNTNLLQNSVDKNNAGGVVDVFIKIGAAKKTVNIFID